MVRRQDDGIDVTRLMDARSGDADLTMLLPGCI